MKAPSRSAWLTALALVPVLLAPVAGESTAIAGGHRSRTCDLDGVWRNGDRGTTNNFTVSGLLTRNADGSANFTGQYQDGTEEATIDGVARSGAWNFTVNFTSGMIKMANGPEQETGAANQFLVEGVYTTLVDGRDANRSGSFTLSGTCARN